MVFTSETLAEAGLIVLVFLEWREHVERNAAKATTAVQQQHVPFFGNAEERPSRAADGARAARSNEQAHYWRWPVLNDHVLLYVARGVVSCTETT